MDKMLALKDFCDMQKFNEILANWSESTHMSAIVMDKEKQYIAGPHGFSRYCRLIRSTRAGMARCVESSDLGREYYTCHAGLYDFTAPIRLPDGREIAYLHCGQAADDTNGRPDFTAIGAACGVNPADLAEGYQTVPSKTKREITAARALLQDAVDHFVEKSYRAWLRRHEAGVDKTLSQITKILYSFNLTVNLETFRYTLITGTGLDRTVEIFKQSDSILETMPRLVKYIHPAYQKTPLALVREKILGTNPIKNGFVGSVEYPVLYPGDEKYEWQEINIFVSTDENGQRIANLLGRDVTEAHETQERNEKELKAAAAKNQILSELTKMLYSYNLTLNLHTGKYSMIVGTGMTKFMEIFKSTDNYEVAYQEKLKWLDPETIDQFTNLASLEALRARRNSNGFIGSAEYGALTDNGEEWHEINVFISTDEAGEPIANILGRDITDAHRRQEQKENAQRAAMARDQLLSGVTKMLYSYNLTVNLETWTYTLITGTGMRDAVRIMESMDDYVLLNSRLMKAIVPEDKRKVAELVGIEALQKAEGSSGYVGSLTYESIYHGESQWHEMNLFMGSDENGAPIANILGRDITEAQLLQKKREMELKASAAKDQILSEITRMMYSYNLTLNLESGKYSLIIGTGMKKFVDIFASTNDYAVSYTEKMSHVLPEYREPFAEIASLEALRARRDERGFLGSREYAANGDNGLEWHEINVFISTNEDDEPVANILGRDITEIHNRQEQRERELKASAARDELLSGVTKMLYSFNATINLNTWKYSLITGTGMNTAVPVIQASDDYGETFHRLKKLILPEYAEVVGNLLSKEAILSMADSSGYIDTIVTAANVDGSILWQEFNLFMGTDENGEPVANLLGRDITEAHEKADTKAQLEIAQAANEAKSLFLSNMSHDIRTPINGIMGMLAIAKTHREDTALVDEALDKIEISSRHLLTLINDILDLNKLESGKMVFAREPLDICKLSREVFTIVEPMAREAELTMDMPGCSGCEHARVMGSPLHIREVLLNILSNAVKYNKPKGSIHFTVEETGHTEETATFRFTVEDTGIGMSQAFQQHMFEAFNQESTQVKPKYQGSGLGLSIVKRIVDQMEGTIDVRSVQDEGSTFVVSLTFEIDPNPVTAEETAGLEHLDTDITGVKILLVEDNELNMEIAQFMLEEAGGAVTTAADGQLAVEAFAASEPGTYDVILMDIQMPNMDGLTATRMIRQMNRPDAKTIPIFAMTANAFAEDVQNSKAAGMNEHLAKPLDMPKVLAAIARCRK